MNILIIGDAARKEELQNRLGEGHQYLGEEQLAERDSWDLLFDLDFEQQPEQFELYRKFEGKTVIVNAVNLSFAALYAEMGEECKCTLAGFNGLPTFMDRTDWELKAWKEGDKPALEELFSALDVKARWVKDRVGMVMPRVLFMIINEACYTLQEGTASIADIDQGMRLGTNYPFGPFEWADRVGIRHVYECLDALYEDTREPRYKICPLLKTHYLRDLPFHS